MMKKTIQNLFAIVVFGGLSTLSPAQWVGTSIHPAGYTQSRALGASEGIVVGWSGSPNAGAGYWLNGGSNYVSLDDPTWTFSVAYHGNSSVQVGSYTKSFTTHASKWNGSLATFEDLNPARSTESQASSILGNKIGGYARINDDAHAVVWNGGGAEDYVDLHPAIAIWSGISTMTESNQIGTVTLNGLVNHAALWSGTAESFVDLGPAGSFESEANAGAGNRQGGWSNTLTQERHAHLWSGTSASAIDLNPFGELTSAVSGMSAQYQVGYSYNSTTEHSSAQIWSGSAASAVNLGSFLPADFVNSFATSVVEYEDRIEVYGYGNRRGVSTSEALKWVQPVPEPGSLTAIGLGILRLARIKRRK